MSFLQIAKALEEENLLTKDKAVVMDLTGLETPDEKFLMVLFKVMMPVPNQAELREFFIGSNRRYHKHMGRIDNFRVFTLEELAGYKEREVDNAIIWLTRKLAKALQVGYADYNKTNENNPENHVLLDFERYEEIFVVPYSTDDHAYVLKAKESWDKANVPEEKAKNGYDLIMDERREQVLKHGFDSERDRNLYPNGELVAVAKCIVEQTNEGWPVQWPVDWWAKIMAKERVGQLAVAGALLMAEEERTGEFNKYEKDWRSIADTIDGFLPKTNSDETKE